MLVIKNAFSFQIRLLHQYDADLEARDKDGLTPLHAAAASRSSSDLAAQALVDAGADALTKDSLGNTPAHAACRHGQEAVLSVLLSSSSFSSVPGAANHSGETPLHLAASHPETDGCLRLLLRDGDSSSLDVKARRKDGRTALHLAALHGEAFSLTNNLLRLYNSFPFVSQAASVDACS